MKNPDSFRSPFHPQHETMPLTTKGDLFEVPNANAVVRVYDALKFFKLAEESFVPTLRFEEQFHTTIAGALTMICTTKQHHNKLREFGIKIPSHRYAVRSGPVIVSTTELVPSTALSREGFPPELVKEGMVRPLLRYYEWLADTKQPYGLADLVGKPWAMGYSGEQFSISDDDNGYLFLHDTPPVVFPTNNPLFAIAAGTELKELWEYGSELEPHIPFDEYEQLEADFIRTLEKVKQLGMQSRGLEEIKSF